MTELAGAAPDEKSSPVQKAVATAVTIPDVPSEIEKRTGYCLVMCTYSVLRYWERRGALRNALPSYDGFKDAFGRYVDLLGLPPNKLNDYLREVCPKEHFKVQHKTGNIEALEAHIRNKTPVIALFDYNMYQRRQPARSTHATVIVGYTPENLLANDPFHGNKYPYEKSRFQEAWALKDNKYILITARVTLNSFT